jgi:ubiquinone/menaquinone biosynthesis C-methylase UbiE
MPSGGRDLAPHCKWTSVDAVAIDDTVQVADLGALPFDDCHFQAAVLSRALWGRDHAKQLAEAFRVLNYGVPLIVCESKQRWTSDDGTNQLLEALKSAGFHIKVGPEENDEVFQYIIAQKPSLL